VFGSQRRGLRSSRPFLIEFEKLDQRAEILLRVHLGIAPARELTALQERIAALLKVHDLLLHSFDLEGEVMEARSIAIEVLASARWLVVRLEQFQRGVAEGEEGELAASV
jgi:hypothetical protein